MIDTGLDDFVATLQGLALPPGTPVLPGLDVAAHLSVPGAPGEAHGAWFDVVPVPSGAIALVVGQVPGSGLTTALAAAQVASVVRASLEHDGDLTRTVLLADAHATRHDVARGTSLTIALVAPATGEVEHLSAGQGAPLLARADDVRRLPGRPAGLLGCGGASGQLARATMEVGDDVVVTSAVSWPDDAPAALRALGARGSDRPAADRCSGVARRLRAGQARGAVVVVAASRRADPTADLDLELAIDPTTTRRARSALDDWLATIDAPAMASLALVHAAIELVTNAVEHAYVSHDIGGPVGVHGTHRSDGVVEVVVVDRGQWRAPSSDHPRGRGLAMAAGLASDLTVVTDDQGTRATVRQALVRPGEVDVSASDQVDDDELVVVEEDGNVRLSGVLGHDEADDLAHVLHLASRGRTQAIEVDLTGLSAVSAAGLRVLHDFASRDADSPPRAHVAIVVRRGGAPQAELERARIPHRVVDDAPGP